jgi:hypothetical protein
MPTPTASGDPIPKPPPFGGVAVGQIDDGLSDRKTLPTSPLANQLTNATNARPMVVSGSPIDSSSCHLFG